MAFRILHTSDWQIGMQAAHVGLAAQRVREARFEAAQRVVDLANEHAVDTLVLAGDTFEDTDLPGPLVQRVVDLLRRSRAPVFVLPANHDPLVPRGVFEHPAWRSAEPGVRVLRSAEPVRAGEALLLPCPLLRRSSPEDPTEVLASSTDTATIRVGIAHGSLIDAGAPADQIADDFPIDRAVVQRARLDYLALGHWHVPSQHEVDGVTRAAYCGSHEPTKFGEASSQGRSGQCLLVEIDGPTTAPRVQALRTAVLDWRQSRRELRGRDDATSLRAEIDREPAASRQCALLDLEISGTIEPTELGAINELAELAAARFLFARVRTERLLLLPSDDSWVSTLPPGVPQSAARRLLEQAGSASEDHAVARGALDLLYQLAREATR